MRSTRARRAAMIGTAALLLAAPCVALAQAEPAPPAPALPADMVTAIGRDLGLSPDQYLEQAETGQELLRFADTLRGKFPTAFAGVWLDAAGAPLVGLADGPDKAAARTAVEAAGYQVKDQPRSEQVLSGLLGQLNGWIQQLPAPLAGLINGTAIDPAANDIALNVKDTAEGQGLQLPGFLNFVRVAKGPAASSDLPGLGSLGSSGSSDPTKPTKPTEPTTTTKPTTTKPTEPTTTTNPVASTITLDPITAAPDSNEYTLKAKVTPAAAGGTVEFKDGNNIIATEQVEADGTATRIWYAQTDGKHTITATFSGRDGVAGSTTTAQVTVAPAGSNTVASTITLDPIKGAIAGGKIITLKAKVNPAAAGGTVVFEVVDRYHEEVPVGADGTATEQWYPPETAGKVTMTATFSGRDGVTGSTTTQQVTVAPAATTTTKPTTTKPTPAPDAVMGGQQYFTGETADKPCSLGFNGTDGDGNTVNITAGHCDAHPENAGNVDATPASMGPNKFGEFDKVVRDRGDYGVIKIYDSVAKRFQNNFVDTYGGDPLAITGTADPLVGAPVCKSGKTTGYTCGKITAINQYMNSGPRGATVPNAFAAKLCTIVGDSGGAMVTGTKALGIVSAGDDGNCDKPMTTWGQPINSVLAANPGLKIRTN
ncbi:Ig-like domain repeat protein [Rhodococcus maanshanensis]|uniref:Ig-like domain (Group 3) n=1 Tax=Rhodococcus maanshanensis TaxID=183556 RepID=A0A1H7KKS8_9NOCA|nr:Ig-like domain repeat protein [Rhodococcus maanshanensis]SEK86557.1 Ig-like domain (group 3) [Rhodococcus maanshanensis]